MAEEIKKYDFGKYEATLLKDLKSAIFGNGKMGMKTHVILLQFQFLILFGAVSWMIKLLYEILNK